MTRASGFLVVCLLAGSTALAREARAQDAKTCAGAYVSAQKLRAKSQLRESREQLLVCSRDACSATLRVDCVRWLAEVEAAMPTVVFAVRSGDGKDLSDVQVSMDGQKLSDHVGGAAIPIDPGNHLFHFDAAGAAPIEQQVVIREGEKAREIRAAFAGSSPPPPAAETAGSTPVAAYVVGAGGIALLALGTYFEVSGLSSKSSASNCLNSSPPSCSSNTYNADVSSAKQSFVAGDLLVGAGLATVAVGLYLFLSRSHAGASHAVVQAVDLRTTLGGGVATVVGRF